MLQCRLSTSEGHDAPPWRAIWWILRERWCAPAVSPPAHTLEHNDQLPHAVTSQSTGQGCILQWRTCCTALHAPLWDAALTTLLLRVCVPGTLPQPCWQDRVHVDHSVQSPSSHGAGIVVHACVLHAVVCTRPLGPGHSAAPLPNAGCTIERRRVFSPPSHGLSHSPYEPQAARTQSTGQACSLHAADCSRAGAAWPPWRAATTTLRWRRRWPPPHVFEHEDHGPKLDT